MRSIKMIGLALVAVLAMGVASASASAHMFKSTEEGPLEAEALTAQEFTTEAGTISCSTLKLKETSAPSGERETQIAKIEYSGCTAYIFFSAKVSLAEYEFNANGTARVLKPITIEVPADGCTVHVPAQGPLSAVAYKDLKRKPAGQEKEFEGIELSPNVTGIASSGEGGCEYSEEGEAAKGEYAGKSFVWLTKGGVLSWS